MVVAAALGRWERAIPGPRPVALIFLCAFLWGLAAFTTSAEGGGRGSAAVDIMESIVADESLGDVQSYRGSLEAAILSEAGVGGVMRIDERGGAAPSVEAALEAARRAGCRFLVELRLEKGAEGQLRAGWKFYDAATGAASSGGEFEKAVPGRATLASSFWSEILVDLDTLLASPHPSVALEIRAPTGTLIEGAGPRLEVPSSGRLVVDFDVPLIVAWTARIPGQFPLRGSIRVNPGLTRLKIDERRWSLGLGLVGLSFPEATLSYALRRDFSLRIGVEQYFLGLHLSDRNSTGSTSFWSSIPLLIPSVGAEYSPFPPASVFRPYVSAAILARLAFLPDGQPYLDPLAAFGSKLRIGCDWGLDRGFRPWLEIGANFYPWADPRGLAASAGLSGGVAVLGGPAFIPGSTGWTLELPLASAGFKVGL